MQFTNLTELGRVAKQNGFEDEGEFHRLVSEADVSTPGKVFLFKEWQLTDGSKEGLLKLEGAKDEEI